MDGEHRALRVGDDGHPDPGSVERRGDDLAAAQGGQHQPRETGAAAQVISYAPRTGDVWVDTELGGDRRVEGIEADYIALEVPDSYVYGYGMDYHEQGRNLPGIYALVR